MQQKGLGDVLGNAFKYWSKTIMYQVFYSLTFFSILFMVFYYFSLRYGILDDFLRIIQNNTGDLKTMQNEIQKLQKNPALYNLSLAMIFTNAFLYPLNLGFFQIFRKIDLKQKYALEDLFAGYNGSNFFKFFGFYLFWSIIFQYASITGILAVVWVVITFFSAPLMFFMDKRIFETIELNFKALRLYFVEICVGILVAIMFKYVGFMLFFVGGLFTFPFWNAIIYALYQKIFTEKN